MATLRELNRQYTELLNQVDAEKKRKIKLEQTLKAATEHKFGWEADIEGLGLDELELFRATLEEMRKKVAKRAEEVAIGVSYSTPFFGVKFGFRDPSSHDFQPPAV